MPTNSQSKRALILVVDDSPLILALLDEFLGHQHELIKAKNGEEALALSLDRLPEMIITDLMMPEMDGYTLLKAIRSHHGLGHVPVIMLTAVDTNMNEQEGYRMGVDAYLTKPFDREELVLRVNNILENRRKTMAFARMDLNSTTDLGTSFETAFIHRLDRAIEKHVSQSSLKVAHLADELAVSVSTLERKIKHLMDTTPKLYVRDYRLSRAMQLLKQRRGNVKEIAVMCGFDNNSYFTSCFKEKYNMLPSELLGASFAQKAH